MNADQFTRIQRAADGAPIVRLMRDPGGAAGPDDPDGLFVSLVPKGANGRRYAVVKADGGEPPALPAAPPEGAMSRAWKRFGELFAAERAAKGGAEVFDAAIYPRRVFEALNQGTDALWSAFYAILDDEAIKDKPAAMGEALDRFVAFIKREADTGKAAKAEDLAVISTAAATLAAPPPRDPPAAKAGKVISSANAGRIRQSADAINAEADKLIALLREVGAYDEAAKAAAHLLEDPVRLSTEQINAIGDLAVKTAKAANPNLSASDLASIATSAAIKAMNDQPGMPDGELARLMTESGAFATGASPLADLESKIMGLPKIQAMKTELDRLAAENKALKEAVNGKPATKSADGADVPEEPGVAVIARKALEIANALGRRAAGIPDRPAGGADPGREPGKKAEVEDILPLPSV